ncbi:hypothetical protein OG339_06720 [Streptosporangium sp. NBC_01495]|uniref:hypothetical protein n=1 Tax=Streptosporangium sp. NBC_01495 TaxID=2903899 RepID=UPI002E348428|nr:hypothetical protein [Streptosporangium sp. NBC_01495]
MASNVTRLYQAVLRDPAAPISIRLRRTFSEWVVEKGFPPPGAARAMVEAEAGQARLTMERRGDCGRYTLDEPYGEGHLRTRVTYAESVPGMTGWVIVTVDRHEGREPERHRREPYRHGRREPERRETERRERREPVVSVPGFLPAYLRTARISDGGVHVEDGPVVLHEDGLDRFVPVMTEPRRRVPILVLSVDLQNPEAARAHADYLAGAVTGASLVVRLADMRAQNRFNKVMGKELGVFGGGIRTYVAPFDPAGEPYPRRHPPMGAAMIRDQGDAALDRIVTGAVGESVHRELPEDVQRTLHVVYRVLAGRADLSEIAAAAVLRPAKTDPAREELRRRMMAMTRRPAPATAGGTTGISAGQPGPGSEKPTAADATAETEEIEKTEETVTTAGVPAFGTGEIAQVVADMVVKELRGELETALGLATSSQAAGGDSARVLREIRTLGAHLSGLRDVVAEQRGNIVERRSDLTERRGNGAERRGDAARRGNLAERRGDLVERRSDAAEQHGNGAERRSDLAARHGDAAERRGDEPLAEDVGDRPAAEIRSLREEHRLLTEEYAEAVTNARKLTERVRWLEGRLAEAGQPVYGVNGEVPVFEPASLVEVLIEARESLRHIVVGDTDGAAARLDLDHPAQSRTWAAKAWDSLRALEDFARARSGGKFAGGFYEWCAHGSPGRLTIPTGMLSMRESKSVVTRAKFSDRRTFAVPPEVNPGGQVLMESHVKLRPVGYPAPRMYFHDDSGGATGKIWIGYLGGHLPNTRTN